jgi:hypothetical protein
MDNRTVTRELDEMIARVQSVTEREIALSHTQTAGSGAANRSKCARCARTSSGSVDFGAQ